MAAHKNEAAAVESAATTVPPQADIEQRKPSRGKDAPDAEEALPGAGEETPRVSRFALLAASLALAAALGAMVGALAAYGIARPAATAAEAGRTGMDEVQALKENVVQTRVELAALKPSIDTATRNAATQFTKIGERIDRVERAQAEPVAKLNKAIDAHRRTVARRGRIRCRRCDRGDLAAGGARQGRGSRRLGGTRCPSRDRPAGRPHGPHRGRPGRRRAGTRPRRRDPQAGRPLGRGDPERPDHAAALIERSPGSLAPTTAAADVLRLSLSPARAWRRTPDPWQISPRLARRGRPRLARKDCSMPDFARVVRRRRSPRRTASPRRPRRSRR